MSLRLLLASVRLASANSLLEEVATSSLLLLVLSLSLAYLSRTLLQLSSFLYLQRALANSLSSLD
jgi:hypothetical protein